MADAKLIDQVKDRCRVLGYSTKTRDTYWRWMVAFMVYSKNQAGNWVHPSQLGRDEIEKYLTQLAVKQNVSPNTQNLALQGILFLYRQVLKEESKLLNGRQ